MSIEIARSILEHFSDSGETKPPMEWLKELPENDYQVCLERFKSHPLCTELCDKMDALRVAFWWGNPDSESYTLFLALNRKWRSKSG